MDKLYSEDEMIYYENDEELVNKIAYFLKNDDLRKKVARKGWEKAHLHLNECLVAQFIKDILCNNKLSHPYIWSTEKIV